ncbi:hypothetical protein GCM10010341_80420 [Streptomyces noursei]|nr:hypothetical protein GCM10010341_80420 [Streptomyces noursei]
MTAQTAHPEAAIAAVRAATDYDGHGDEWRAPSAVAVVALGPAALGFVVVSGELRQRAAEGEPGTRGRLTTGDRLPGHLQRRLLDLYSLAQRLTLKSCKLANS